MAVRTSRRPERSKSFSPSDCSRARICALTVGWEMWRRSLARVTLPSRAAAQK
jgi:hypothetical protein